MTDRRLYRTSSAVPAGRPCDYVAEKSFWQYTLKVYYYLGEIQGWPGRIFKNAAKTTETVLFPVDAQVVSIADRSF
jgi:hypothetical protein